MENATSSQPKGEAIGGTVVSNQGTLTLNAKTILLNGQVSISASGTIPTPNASTVRVSQAFVTTLHQLFLRYLTYDSGSTSTNCNCLTGFVVIAGAWTGLFDKHKFIRS